MSVKGQGQSLTLVKSHSDFKVKTCFSQKQLEPKFIWKLKGEWEWKFIQMSWVTWPTWPPCPYMVKTLKKSSSPDAIGRWPWKLVCSIVYASTTKVVQIMTLGWPWPILRQGQIWSHRILYGEKWKLFIFLETIAALGLKVAWSIQLNKLMKLSIKGQRHPLALVKGHSDFKVNCLTLACILRWTIQGHLVCYVWICNTVELQWVEHWLLVYHGCFELVLESLGKIPWLQI